MIKEALEYIVGLKKPEVIEIEERRFTNRDYSVLHEPQQNTVEVNTLSGIVDLINNDYKKPCYILCKSPNKVEVVSEIYGVEKQRDTVYVANNMRTNNSFGYGQSMEQFIIWLQSGFFKDENRDLLLKVASSIEFGDNQQIRDDGVSQIVTAKTGVARLENIKLPNPITLRPYRTFREVEQPASQFVFRISNNGQFTLHEADGGAWEIEAVNNIKTFFDKQFKGNKDIVVIA